MIIVLEWCEKGDLAEMLGKQNGAPLEEEAILKIFTEICFGLLSLHQRRVFHRDLKLENIFVTKDGNAKIADLGISRVMDRTMQLVKTGVMGTMAYMSPEMFNGEPYSVKSDIWALGCILYRLCALRGPFEATNEGQQVNLVLNSRHARVPERYSQELGDLVDWMLTKEPENRPNIVEILRSDIMAGYLLRNGYEPAFIGTLTEKLKMVIEMKTTELAET